ncbi:DUF6978 family protein [Streptococcus danieliae]|uniref:DUF6978 family protein n=1 Tax=Streptococcus danieliae TaxID=747656 RepID=UPI0021C8E097|nr:hypothetical protein [Streptococcus danieliae]MCU0082524.1 hypothetical protein [Streptococcus danieliae]
MKELLLTDEQADELLNIMKVFASRHDVTLTNNTNGRIDIVGENNNRFILDYFYNEHNKVFNFRETRYNYTLFRINLNNKFHKNADGTIVRGNRINIFSADEYYQKSDETTHYRAFPLPYDKISNSDDFLRTFEELIDFANITERDKVSFKIQDGLL